MDNDDVVDDASMFALFVSLWKDGKRTKADVELRYVGLITYRSCFWPTPLLLSRAGIDIESRSKSVDDAQYRCSDR